MNKKTKTELIELDNLICRDNVFLFEALEIKAANVEESLYNTINTPNNINPIKSIMN